MPMRSPKNESLTATRSLELVDRVGSVAAEHGVDCRPYKPAESVPVGEIVRAAYRSRDQLTVPAPTRDCTKSGFGPDQHQWKRIVAKVRVQRVVEGPDELVDTRSAAAIAVHLA